MAEPLAARPYMPGYGIAESTEALLPWSWALQRLLASQRYSGAAARRTRKVRTCAARSRPATAIR
jgi:hypothetical protein